MVDKMKNLDRNLGPWSLRVWGLILNFFGNALAIFGLVGLIRDGSRLPIFLIGSFLTITCILVLAKPSPD
jgi:hypothetical protein